MKDEEKYLEDEMVKFGECWPYPASFDGYDKNWVDELTEECAKHFYELGKKDMKEQDEKELSEKIAAAYQLGIKDKEQKSMEGLDEVAKAYALDTAEDSEQYSARYLGYKDGAKWQKQEMLKEARNHFVYNILSGNDMKKMIELYNDEVSCKPGDVVRIIIVKED